MARETAIIIGAGPAGLTAAYELLTRTKIRPVVLEASGAFGGISRTVSHNGNRMDIGGHRFFSKSDRVMKWWLDMMPLEETQDSSFVIQYQGSEREIDPTKLRSDERDPERVMLVRTRRSRIFFLRRFFDYPLRINVRTVRNLGARRMIRILASYLRAHLRPIRNESNLEEFLINRFGRELYLTFFKSYTEKVWGVPCDEISAEWGAQRIKGLSISRAVAHALRELVRRDQSLSQKKTETSLIERFLYPKYGPGQMWEVTAEEVMKLGGEVITHRRVTALAKEGSRIRAVTAVDPRNGERSRFEADYVFSTMPVVDLVRGLEPSAPANVLEVTDGLRYRDFITVGILIDKLNMKDPDSANDGLLQDNWIYVQEPDVLVGRLQIFNNWSPWMVGDPTKVWMGMEYFCDESDGLWQLSDEEMTALAVDELERLGFIQPGGVRDATVIRMPKTYPAYFGTYDRFGEIREFLDPIENLFLVGRNGMHRYNNQDHSMLAAMTAVDNILAGTKGKTNVWEVNTEQEYHESR